MFRTVAFFRIEAPLGIDKITRQFAKIKNKPRKVKDKNVDSQKITLGCKFNKKEVIDGNYILGVSIEHQVHPKKDTKYQKIRDYFIFIFFTNDDFLAVLGRPDVRRDAVNVVMEMLYPQVEDMQMFSPVSFDVNSVVKTINVMKKDDSRSWCSDYGGMHDAVKYQNKKTKSNFSLGEGECVLDDPEAKEAIRHSTTIGPKYKFHACPKLNERTYNRARTMQFSGKNGTVTIFTPQEFKAWYRFILDFLLDSLVFVPPR